MAMTATSCSRSSRRSGNRSSRTSCAARVSTSRIEMPTIRPLAPNDCLTQLTALLHASYASLAAQGWNFTAVDQTVDVTRDRLAGAQGFVAELHGRLVGTIA